jgi:hypothetical protein
MIATSLATELARPVGRMLPRVGGGVRPTIQRFAAIGDSITDRMSTWSGSVWGGHVSLGLDGWGAALEVLSGHRLKSIARPIPTGMGTPVGYDRDWAYSGANARQWMLGAAAGPGSDFFNSHVPSVAFAPYANQADVAIVNFGTNDFPGTTPAQRAERIVAVWTYLRSLGCRVIGTDILPRSSNTSGGWTGAQQAPYDECNDILRAAASSAGLWSYRRWADLFARDGNNVALPVDFAFDGFHPHQRVGLRLARDLYSFLQPYLSGPEALPPPPSDPSWVTPDPYIQTGLGGANVGWANLGCGVLGENHNVSKITDPDGRSWLRMQAISLPTNSSTSGYYSRITTGLPAPDTVCRICARVRATDTSTLTGVALEVQQVGVVPAWRAPYGYGIGVGVFSPIEELDEVLMYSDPFKIQAGAVQIWALVGMRATGAATLDFREAGIFRV